MKRKSAGRSIGVARLAMYAENPSEAIEPRKEVSQKALQHGNKAHASIGKKPPLVPFEKKPSIVPFIVGAIIVVWAIYNGYIPW